MIETLKKFGGKKLGGLILIAVIIIAFGFGGFGGGFSTNNQNNIAKINKTNVTTQDFMNYLNQSGISQQAIRENLNNNIIEELLSGLISTKLIDLEVEDFNISITKLSVLKKVKQNYFWLRFLCEKIIIKYNYLIINYMYLNDSVIYFNNLVDKPFEFDFATQKTTVNNFSSSTIITNTINSSTGSFSHIEGNSPITFYLYYGFGGQTSFCLEEIISTLLSVGQNT